MAKRTETREIPQQEMILTIKALLLEHVLGWERSLDKSGEWKWVGIDPASGDEVTCVGWKALPNVMGSMEMLLRILVVFVTSQRTPENRFIWSQAYDIGLDEPFVCRFVVIDGNQPRCVSECKSNNYQASVALAMLQYLNIVPVNYHRVYFPTSGLQIAGGRSAIEEARREQPESKVIELGQSGLGNPRR